ncbi:MAG TPA: hypothetical protein PLN38_07460 [Chitinophagales bacterium]|nr:hypothetical protein [Chitinophagales bacterium]
MFNFGQNNNVTVGTSAIADNKEIEIFFRNIQQGLSKYSLQEINESLEAIINNDEHFVVNSKKRINTVLDVVCDDFKITKHMLLHGRGKGVVQEARVVAFCVLHNDFNLSMRYIALSVFKMNWHTSVSKAIQYYKSLNMQCKPDRLFNEKLVSIKDKINNAITKKGI